MRMREKKLQRDHVATLWRVEHCGVLCFQSEKWTSLISGHYFKHLQALIYVFLPQLVNQISPGCVLYLRTFENIVNTIKVQAFNMIYNIYAHTHTRCICKGCIFVNGEALYMLLRFAADLVVNLKCVCVCEGIITRGILWFHEESATQHKTY